MMPRINPCRSVDPSEIFSGINTGIAREIPSVIPPEHHSEIPQNFVSGISPGLSSDILKGDPSVLFRDPL